MIARWNTAIEQQWPRLSTMVTLTGSGIYLRSDSPTPRTSHVSPHSHTFRIISNKYKVYKWPYLRVIPLWCNFGMMERSSGNNLNTWAISDLPWTMVSFPCESSDSKCWLFEAQYAAVVAAFALSCSTAVMTSVNYDDLLATAHKYAKSSELKPVCVLRFVPLS